MLFDTFTEHKKRMLQFKILLKRNLFSLFCRLLPQFRVVTAPFHRVGFADFWLADQLNSLVVVLMDLEYMICFYSFELDWRKHDGLISSEGETVRQNAPPGCEDLLSDNGSTP